jgi:hypothetical protein
LAADTRTSKSDRDAETVEDKDGAGFFPDLLRKGLTLGFTGLFMTEEAIRKALGESVPRDVLEFMLEQSERTRAEFLDRLSQEFGRAVAAMDPVELARRLLDGRTVEVSARIRLVPEKRDAKDAKTAGGSEKA